MGIFDDDIFGERNHPSILGPRNPPPIAYQDLEAWARERPGLRSYTTSYMRIPDGGSLLIVRISEFSEFGLQGNCRETSWAVDGSGELYVRPNSINIVRE